VADQPTTGEVPPEQPDAEVAFAEQAKATGLVLPKKAASDPWGAVVIIVALIVLTAGIGEVTGWVNLRAPTQNNGNFETQTCTGSNVRAIGSVSDVIGPQLGTWLAGAGQNLSQAVGGCFSVVVTSNSGDGYLPLLGGSGSEFVATYTAPSPSEASQLPDPVALVPVALSAVAVIYNLPGLPPGLNLTGAILAGIYNGTITSWDDPAIVGLNPGTNLTGLPVISPTDQSGIAVANQVFSGFLATSSPVWNSTVGAGTDVAWPAGTSVDSAAAMVDRVAATAGAIGYLELFGAAPAGVESAQIEDAAGDFASPGVVDTWIAANSLSNASAVKTGNWTGFSFYSAPAVGSYPLAVLSYAGIYQDLGVAYSGSLGLSNATWLLTYLYWLTSEATVAPLPPAFATDAMSVLNNETYNGTAIVHLENENGENGESGGETGEF
jgi:phosphate transport system substrate-binding protein